MPELTWVEGLVWVVRDCGGVVGDVLGEQLVNGQASFIDDGVALLQGPVLDRM
jgi:hypothetical protein